MNGDVFFSTENRYSRFEPKDSSDHVRRSINGTTVGCSKCVGYCQYSEHPGFLTKEQRQEHNCIKKGCRYYIAKTKETKKPQSLICDQSRSILSFIEKMINANDGFRILRVEFNGGSRYHAKFITITNSYNFDAYKEVIKNTFGVDIVFDRLDYDFDRCAELLFAG